MTTINLRDGLEALYYFGEQDFDPQRNQLQDHSGYGRHATAQGGPTVGVNGPNDFEATSFDGNDDIFDTGYSNLITSDFTIFAIAKVDDQNDFYQITGNELKGASGGAQLAYNSSSNGWEITLRDGSDNRVRARINGVDDEYYSLVGGKRDSIAFITDGENRDIQSITGTTDTSSVYKIGNSTSFGIYFKGDIATVCYWSRALSDAEIDQLTRLTAPRRAQL